LAGNGLEAAGIGTGFQRGHRAADRVIATEPKVIRLVVAGHWTGGEARKIWADRVAPSPRLGSQPGVPAVTIARVNSNTTSLPRWKALCSLMLTAGLLAACATPGKPSGAAPAPDGAPRVSDGAAAPAPLPTPAPAPEPPPPPPMTPQEIRIAVEKTAVELLEQGQEEQATAELQRVLRQEPNHRLANSLMRQIRDDPQTLLGRESFSYRVQSGETLSRIAGRYLGDIYLFYGLARYNGIKVPRQVQGGQQIKVPGKAPPPGTAPPPAPAPPAPPPPAPPPVAAPPAPATPDPAAEAARLERERTAAIARYSRAARAASAKQDLDGAITNWDRVIELDPNNSTAKLERQRAVDLKARLGKL
jgi:LysM repeat protein